LRQFLPVRRAQPLGVGFCHATLPTGWRGLSHGGRRCDIVSRDVEPFMRYLARCAPHLREVGLFCAVDSAVLAFRRAMSMTARVP
jgi:hypothetical protein